MRLSIKQISLISPTSLGGRMDAVNSFTFLKQKCNFSNHSIFLCHPRAVDGAWDEWTPWSLCSSTCGRGYRDRTRTCKLPKNGGEPCRGPTRQTKFCNIAVCPGDTSDLNLTQTKMRYHCPHSEDSIVLSSASSTSPLFTDSYVTVN